MHFNKKKQTGLGWREEEDRQGERSSLCSCYFSHELCSHRLDDKLCRTMSADIHGLAVEMMDVLVTRVNLFGLRTLVAACCLNCSLYAYHERDTRPG